MINATSYKPTLPSFLAELNQKLGQHPSPRAIWNALQSLPAGGIFTVKPEEAAALLLEMLPWLGAEDPGSKVRGALALLSAARRDFGAALSSVLPSVDPDQTVRVMGRNVLNDIQALLGPTSPAFFLIKSGLDQNANARDGMRGRHALAHTFDLLNTVLNANPTDTARTMASKVLQVYAHQVPGEFVIAQFVADDEERRAGNAQFALTQAAALLPQGDSVRALLERCVAQARNTNGDAKRLAVVNQGLAEALTLLSQSPV